MTKKKFNIFQNKKNKFKKVDFILIANNLPTILESILNEHFKSKE
jgi:uncharacterized protein YegP (UPF0339 family)